MIHLMLMELTIWCWLKRNQWIHFSIASHTLSLPINLPDRFQQHDHPPLDRTSLDRSLDCCLIFNNSNSQARQVRIQLQPPPSQQTVFLFHEIALRYNPPTLGDQEPICCCQMLIRWTPTHLKLKSSATPDSQSQTRETTSIKTQAEITTEVLKPDNSVFDRTIDSCQTTWS